MLVKTKVDVPKYLNPKYLVRGRVVYLISLKLLQQLGRDNLNVCLHLLCVLHLRHICVYSEPHILLINLLRKISE